MPTINGRSVEFAALVMTSAGTTIESLMSASYDAGIAAEVHHATNGAPLDYSLGEYETEPVELEFAKSDAPDFLNGVEDSPRGGKLGGRFTTTVAYSETDQDVQEDSLDCILTNIRDTIDRSTKRTMTRVRGLQVAPMDYQGIELMPAAAAGGGGGGSPFSPRGPSGFPSL